jgi:hypothetical protein
MKRYREQELEAAIKDNESRGFTVVRRWEVPITYDMGARTRYTYCAEMIKSVDKTNIS